MTTWSFWWGLVLDTFRRKRRFSDRERLEALARIRRRKTEERLLDYEIAWAHAEALRIDRARTIRLELERQHQERQEGKVLRLRYTQPWGSR